MTTIDESANEVRRASVIANKTYLTPYFAVHELQQARHYIDTLESFIASSEASETSALSLRTEGMNAEEMDEFWQWNAPVHWQEIFGARIRSAFCTQLCSQIENSLGQIAENVRIVERSPINVRQLKGQSTLDQHKLYLSAFGKFDGPTEQKWKDVKFLFTLRNVCVHNQGFFHHVQGIDQFRTFLQSLPNIGIANDYVDLQTGSCLALHQISATFHQALFAEYEAYLARVRAKEQA